MPRAVNRCRHLKKVTIDRRFQVFWCSHCGAIKTPSALTSGRGIWRSPVVARRLAPHCEKTILAALQRASNWIDASSPGPDASLESWATIHDDLVGVIQEFDPSWTPMAEET